MGGVGLFVVQTGVVLQSNDLVNGVWGALRPKRHYNA
jgi:hypothetical protein